MKFKSIENEKLSEKPVGDYRPEKPNREI